MTLLFEVDGCSRRAAVWMPQDVASRERWPLLVFLHAYEERGDDWEHLGVGIGPALEERPELYRCVVLLPQCPRDHVWTPSDRPWARGVDDAMLHIDASIDAALARLPVDPARVALTGASMGGYGTFHYGSERGDRFTRLGPVCGGGKASLGPKLSSLPTWAWHGAADEVVPVSESREMIEAIRAAGGTDARLTEVPDHGHDAWDVAYRDATFVEFLLE